MGIKDGGHVYKLAPLDVGDVMFAATGVTGAVPPGGVRYTKGGAETSSVVMRSRSGTVRYLQTRHRFEEHPTYDRGGKLR